MLSEKLLCFLLALPLCSSADTSAVDVTVSRGDTAFLPCPIQFKYTNPMKISVYWVKEGEFKFCNYSIENNKTQGQRCSPQIKVSAEPSGLNITGVESSDAGLYKCKMTRVLLPPSEDQFSTVRLKVIVQPSLTLQLINSTNISCVELLCALQDLRTQQVNFTWTIANRLLHHQESSQMKSMLSLCKPNWADGDTVTCKASYSHNHTLYSKSITLPNYPVVYNSPLWLIIAVISTAAAALLLLIVLGVTIFKCKKRHAANGAVVYRNKIYENFTFSSVNPTAYAQTAQPAQTAQSAGSNTRSTTRSNPQTIRQTQREECIYEN